MPGCIFLKNVSSIDRVEPWFFVTFNIILKHIFPENFIEFPQVALDFLTLPCHKETNGVSL